MASFLDLPDDDEAAPAARAPAKRPSFLDLPDDEAPAAPAVSPNASATAQRTEEYSPGGFSPIGSSAFAGEGRRETRALPELSEDSALAGAGRALGNMVPRSPGGLALAGAAMPLMAWSPMLRAGLGAAGATAGLARAAGAVAGGGPAGDVTEPLTEGALGALMAREAAPEAVTNVRRAASALRAAGGAAGSAALERIPYVGPVAKAGWNAGAADLEKTGALRGALRLKDIPAVPRGAEPEMFRAYPPEQGPEPIPGTTETSVVRPPLNVRNLTPPQGPEPMFRDAVPPATPGARRPLVMRPPTQQAGVPGGLTGEELMPQQDAAPALHYPEAMGQQGELLTPEEAQAPRAPTRDVMYRVPPDVPFEDFAGLTTPEFQKQSAPLRGPLKIRDMLSRAAPAQQQAEAAQAEPAAAQELLDRVLDYRNRNQGVQDLSRKPTPDLIPPPYEAPAPEAPASDDDLDFAGMQWRRPDLETEARLRWAREFKNSLHNKNSLYGRRYK